MSEIDLLRSRVVNTINKIITVYENETDKKMKAYLYACMNTLDTVIKEIDNVKESEEVRR